jgi:hypothetical protein
MIRRVADFETIASLGAGFDERSAHQCKDRAIIPIILPGASCGRLVLHFSKNRRAPGDRRQPGVAIYVELAGKVQHSVDGAGAIMINDVVSKHRAR